MNDKTFIGHDYLEALTSSHAPANFDPSSFRTVLSSVVQQITYCLFKQIMINFDPRHFQQLIGPAMYVESNTSGRISQQFVIGCGF